MSDARDKLARRQSRILYNLVSLACLSLLILAGASDGQRRDPALREQTLLHAATSALLRLPACQSEGIPRIVHTDPVLKTVSDQDHVVLVAPEGQQPKRAINALAFLPEQNNQLELMSAGTDTQIRVWDLTDHKAAQTPKTVWTHFDSASSLAYSSDGKYAASGGWDKSVMFWDRKQNVAKSLAENSFPADHDGYVLSVAFRPTIADDKSYLVASGGNDKQVILWHATPEGNDIYVSLALHGDPKRTPQQGITTLAFSPDGNLLAAGSLDGSVYFWIVQPNAASKVGFAAKFVGAIATGQESVRNLVFLAGPQETTRTSSLILATSGVGDSVKLWSLGRDTMHPLLPTADHSRTLTGVSNVFALAYNAPRRLLAAGTIDTRLCFWRISSADPMSTNPNPLKTLVPADHKPPAGTPQDKGAAKKQGIVRSLAFDQSGRWMASGGGGDNSNILLWDLDVLDLSPTKQPKP